MYDHALEVRRGLNSADAIAANDDAAAHSQWPQWNGWQLSDRWTIKAVSSRFCPTCGLGFKDDGGQSILFHFSNSHAHLHTVEALEAQSALFNYSYALQAYEQACYEQQQHDLKDVNAVATVSCNASSTSSSTPRIARDDSSANSEDLEGAAAFKLVQVIDKSDRYPKQVVKKKPTSTSTKPTAATKPTPTFDLKSVPYDSAFPSLGGSDAASNAPKSWAKRPAVVSSRKLDISAPMYTPGTIATAFSSLAVRERREADMPVNPFSIDQSQAVQVANKEVVETVESKAVVSQEGMEEPGKKDKRDKKTPGPGHQERRGRGRGPAAVNNKAPVRSNADDQDSWRKVAANGKAK